MTRQGKFWAEQAGCPLSHLAVRAAHSPEMGWTVRWSPKMVFAMGDLARTDRGQEESPSGQGADPASPAIIQIRQDGDGRAGQGEG